MQSLAFRWEIESLVVAFLELMPPEAQLNMCRSCNPTPVLESNDAIIIINCKPKDA